MEQQACRCKITDSDGLFDIDRPTILYCQTGLNMSATDESSVNTTDQQATASDTDLASGTVTDTQGDSSNQVGLEMLQSLIRQPHRQQVIRIRTTRLLVQTVSNHRNSN